MIKRTIFLLLLCIPILSHAQKNTYRIGVLMDYVSEDLQPRIIQAQNQIKVVVGEDADVVFPDESRLVNDFNLDKAEENYRTLLNNETDIILAFGVVNNVVVSKQNNYPKPTILFGAVNRDMVNVDLKKSSSGIDNFTYFIESYSFSEDLTTFKELTNFKKVGIIAEKVFVDILPYKETFDKIAAELGIEYTLIPFENNSDIRDKLSGLDAAYLAGGFSLTNDQVIELSKIFIENQIPSFTNTDLNDVRNGIYATNQGEEDLDQFLRRIALTVEAYINGNELSELPVFIEYNPRLTVNFNTAALLGIPIKYSLIANTDFVGKFENAVAEEKYNLLEAIQKGLGRNLGLSAVQKNIALTQQELYLAKSNYLPSITAALSGTYVDPNLAEVSLGQSPEFSTSGNVTLNQTIYSPAINANIDIQNELLSAEKENFRAEELDLIFDIANAYFNTLILKSNMQIQMYNLTLTKNNLQIAEQNFEVGQSGKSDVLRFTSELAQNTQNMVQAINSFQQSFIGLNQILNNPLDYEIDIEDAVLGKGVFKEYNYNELTQLLDDPTLREPFIDFLVSEALKNAPELRAVNFNQSAIDRSIELYDKGRYYPTVGFQGQYNRTFNRNGAGSDPPPGGGFVDGYYTLGASVSMPIFNQKQNDINQETASIQKVQLDLNRQNIELGIAANVRFNVLEIINQLSNINLSDVSESAAKEALELTQVAYSSGSVNIIQLLDAQNNYLNAQLAQTNAIYNFLTSVIQLERSMGYYFLLHSEADNTEFRQRFISFLDEK